MSFCFILFYVYLLVKFISKWSGKGQIINVILCDYLYTYTLCDQIKHSCFLKHPSLIYGGNMQNPLSIYSTLSRLKGFPGRDALFFYIT